MLDLKELERKVDEMIANDTPEKMMAWFKKKKAEMETGQSVSHEEFLGRLNYYQIVKQTDKEKLKMYMKLSKKELAQMLINCNNYIKQALTQQSPPRNQKRSEP